MSNSKTYDYQLNQLKEKKATALSELKDRYDTKLANIQFKADNAAADIYAKNRSNNSKPVNVVFWIGIIFLFSLVAVSFLGGIFDGIVVLVLVLALGLPLLNAITDAMDSNIDKKSNHLTDGEKKAIASQKNKELNQLNTWYNNEKNKIENNFINEKKQLDLNMNSKNSKINNLVTKYLSGAAVKQICQTFTKAINTGLKHEDNRSHIKTISTKFEYEVRQTEIIFKFKHEENNYYGQKTIGYFPVTYDFIVENINPLKSQDECEALAESIKQYLTNIFNKKFTAGKVVSTRNDANVEMTFTIVNKNFKAPINV